MLKTKKPIKFTKEMIAQLYEFDLQVDINFSFIDEWEERKKKEQQQEAQSTFDDNQSVMNDNISVMEASVFEQNLPFLNKVNEADIGNECFTPFFQSRTNDDLNNILSFVLILLLAVIE